MGLVNGAHHYEVEAAGMVTCHQVEVTVGAGFAVPTVAVERIRNPCRLRLSQHGQREAHQQKQGQRNNAETSHKFHSFHSSQPELR